MINITVHDLLSLIDKEGIVQILDLNLPFPFVFSGKAREIPSSLMDRHVIRLDVNFIHTQTFSAYALYIRIAKEL